MRHADGEHVAVGDLDAERREQRVLRPDQVRDALLRAAAPQDADVLQDEGEADRRDQRRQLRGRAQRPVADALDHRVQRAGAEHRDRQRDQEAEDEQPRAGALGQADRREEPGRDERADHEHLAVGEVDQLDDAVDHRVADRHQRPDGAVREAVHEVVAQAREVTLVAEQIADAERDRHDQQDDDQPVLPDPIAQCLTRCCWSRRRNACGFHVVETLPERPRRGREFLPTPGRGMSFSPGSAGLSLDRGVELQLTAVDRVDAVVGEGGVAVLVDRVRAEHALAVLGVEERLR